ncbi:MAG: pitrilysin family protein [Dehalococcoidia bacterium]|jgi:predicted Zn-dependent peptidase|nr:pitrilysin family protein [Dehalococcoidia bacterium]
MFRRTVLPSGLRVITSKMPHTRSASLSIFIGIGSRFESDADAGASHFVEHLCFKGTQRRASSKEISEAIEGVGGILNGGTDKELTVYWCKVAVGNFESALDVLSDMILNSKFDSTEVEKERSVIIEEISMTQDNPGQLVNLIIDNVMWPDQPLGRDVAGTKESVGAFTRQHLADFLARHYRAGNVAVSVAGNVEHDAVVESVAGAFAPWQDGPAEKSVPVDDRQNAPRLLVDNRTTEQAHLCLALRGLSNLHPQRFTLDLLNAILGDGMSSRLFLNIREKLGLAYDIHSYTSHLQDTGAWVIYAGVDPEQLPSTVDAALEELGRLREEIPEVEVTRAREYLKGRLLLRMEDTRSVATWLGAQEMLSDRILTVDEVVAMLDAVTSKQLTEVAHSLIATDKLSVAVVGPVSAADLEGRLKL